MKTFIHLFPSFGTKKEVIIIPIDRVPQEIRNGDEFTLSFTGGIFEVIRRRWIAGEGYCIVDCRMNPLPWERIDRHPDITKDPETLFNILPPQIWG